MAKGRGKAFERELRDAFERAGYLVHRNQDSMTNRGNVSKSLPDLTAFRKAEADVLLIECKAVKGVSIAFDRLGEHQENDLHAFEVSLPTYGWAYIAVNFYDGQRGPKRLHRCFLVPLDVWREYRRLGGRKSLPLAAIENDRRVLELPWQPGTGWLVPSMED